MLNPTKNLPDHDPLDLLSTQQICERLSIAPRTLQTWRQSGRFPAPDLAVGKTLRWRRASLERWLDEEREARRPNHP